MRVMDVQHQIRRVRFVAGHAFEIEDETLSQVIGVVKPSVPNAGAGLRGP